MLLAIDIGNTNVTLGAYDDTALAFTARLATDGRMTADQYAIEIKNILSLHGLEYQNIEDCVIASVVPTVGNAISRAVSMLCDIVPLELGPGIKTGLNIKIDNPAQLGADLVAGAVGAISEYTLPCIVIDMGTATTISVINSKGQFLGGAIAAGVRLTLKALSENTSQLPSINISAPNSVIGKNTVDCMRSGLVFGAAAMIDGLIEKMTLELDEIPTIVATGGLSKEIIAHCKSDIIYNENLLLDGLREIYERNK
ncbi:MAG: type III pantothenate kinase [Acutalibacteraceae bacterium]|nr:type III pantothenate kinase [Acutalibacteraceae bacterium]